MKVRTDVIVYIGLGKQCGFGKFCLKGYKSKASTRKLIGQWIMALSKRVQPARCLNQRIKIKIGKSCHITLVCFGVLEYFLI